MLLLGCLVLLTVAARCSAAPADIANTCGAPPGVDNGRVIGTNTNYNHGESAKYTCNKGYKLTEESPAKCLKGDWTNVPECVSTSCPPPPSIDNGRLILNPKAEYASGDKVQYLCNRGYNLEKKNNEATCEETKWKSVPVCRRTGATCSTPPTVQFGVHLGPNQPNYRSGFQIKYKCPSYFKLVGKETVTCEDGVWDEPPVCLEPCSASEKEMRKNNIVFRWIDANKLYTEHDQPVEFICIEGYEIAHRSLLRVRCNKGVIPYPKCNSFGSCLLSEETMKQQNIYLNRNNAIENGEKVLFECNKGFMPENTLEGTCKMRNLNYPKCIISPNSCGAPPGVDNGRVIGTNTNYNHGESAKYTCNKGYKLTEESPAKCLKGDWTNVPECVSTSCPPPPSIDNGRLIPNPKAEYASGDKVQYLCNNGYNLQKKKNEATCEETKWKSVPVCRRTGATCSTPPTVQFGDHLGPNQPNYRSGFQLEYKCPSYFKLAGNKKVKCEDGVWDEPPVCLEPCTVKENDIRKNNIVLRWVDTNKLYMEHDQQTEFICIEGYEFAEGSLIRVKCNKGVIPYPKCNSIGSCLLSEETMKQQNIYLNRNSAIQNGEKVLFECNKGFMPENTLEGTCKMRILNYPKCIISQKCKSLPDVPNGRVKSEELKEDSYDSGSSVEFECDENHKLSGPINVKCETGQWSDLPQCLKPCRISLEELSTNNVELKSQNEANKVIKDSEIVFVKCKTGYRNPTMGIDAKGECYNGKMRYSRCFQKSFCRIDQDNIDENNLELDAIHNDEGYYGDEEDVHFICKNGFRSMTGSLTGKCEKTILTYPRCIPEQTCPIEQGKLEENNLQLNANQNDRFYLEAGESVTFICKPGFKIISPRLLQRKCEKQTLTYPRCTKEISV